MDWVTSVLASLLLLLHDLPDDDSDDAGSPHVNEFADMTLDKISPLSIIDIRAVPSLSFPTSFEISISVNDTFIVVVVVVI